MKSNNHIVRKLLHDEIISTKERINVKPDCKYRLVYKDNYILPEDFNMVIQVINMVSETPVCSSNINEIDHIGTNPFRYNDYFYLHNNKLHIKRFRKTWCQKLLNYLFPEKFMYLLEYK